MRVISGLYGGRVLKSPFNSKTRPTSDKIRETLFNILNSKVLEKNYFLDMCAGTGAIGIEALSRGFKSVVFVDRSKRACALIKENLKLLQVPEEQTTVSCNSAHNFISLHKSEPWNSIFFDPNYDKDYSKTLSAIGNKSSGILAKNGIFIAEHHSKIRLPDVVGEIRRWRLLKQGETCLSFYERN